MAQIVPPRIAVVGGGMAGTICSLVLKNRGLQPIILDAGSRGLGGRLRGDGAGAQFLRAGSSSDPRLVALFHTIEKNNLIARWNGRFGMLGSSGGGFLPADIITTRAGGSGSSNIMGLSSASGGPEEKESPSFTDSGDFCNFVEGSKNQSTFVGIPTMADLCPNICRLANIQSISNVKVVDGTMNIQEGGWNLNIKEATKGEEGLKDSSFDGLVIATHDPSLASLFVKSIVHAEKQAQQSLLEVQEEEKKSDDGEMFVNKEIESLLQNLSGLSDKLQTIRDYGRRPLYSVMATYPDGFSENIPFDAVSVPGSSLLQFLSRNASKPGHMMVTNSPSDTWTAISTSQLASQVLASDLSVEEQELQIQRIITGEMEQLLSPYFVEQDIPKPHKIKVKRWGAAVCGQGLESKGDSILLAPWRLAICGDFIKAPSANSTPLELAALSGLEAGEQMASLFLQHSGEQ